MTTRLTAFLLSATLVALLPFNSTAQVPANLASRKNFSAGRASSTDPNGRNGDSRHIAPGQTLTLMDVKGAGRIVHVWFTINSPSPEHLRELVLRMTWDDASRPAVECPVGDFFAQGHGKYVEFQSAPVVVSPRNALNCYWTMPFKTHAVVTVANEGERAVDNFYFNIDYELVEEAQANARYFHTQYRTYFPAPTGKPLTICETKGAGHFVGTFISVMANSDGWWGEGNDNWYVDGSEKPVISGTGSEDYFCGAWDFGRAFWYPYFGVPYYDNPSKGGEKRGILNTCYRWHIQDPVPFKESLLFTLEHGRSGWDEERKPFNNHYTTVGFFYLDNPEGDGPRIPAFKDRVPVLIPLAAESK
ncbi:MAG: glycoside hydrolase family 172 protein [Limisphaerales bacterium]